jgi:hypothetical protein
MRAAGVILKKSILISISIFSLCLLNGCGSSSPPPPPPAADFSIVISPASVSTQVGGTTSPITVSLNAENGFTRPVTVSASGFANGVDPSPAPPFMLTSGTPHLTSLVDARPTPQVELRQKHRAHREAPRATQVRSGPMRRDRVLLVGPEAPGDEQPNCRDLFLWPRRRTKTCNRRRSDAKCTTRASGSAWREFAPKAMRAVEEVRRKAVAAEPE